MTTASESAYLESWTIPYDVFKRTDLKELSICLDEFDLGNSEALKPGYLKNLLNLTSLDLTGIQISQEIFSDEICSMKNLSKLTLLYAGLSFVPEKIGELIHLEKICFRGGRLSSLPDSFAQLTNLTQLNLIGNDFEEIPTVLLSLPKLNIVNMDGNPLSKSFASFIDKNSGWVDMDNFRAHYNK